MSTYSAPRIFSIHPGQDFLATLVAALCDGNLIPGFKYSGDPLALSLATIFVPTRRAARELRSTLMEHLGNNSILLPHIRPLGEFDEEAFFFESGAEDIIRTPPPIDALERQLILGRLIAQWTDHLTAHLRSLYKEEELTTPVSTSDAFWLARDLADLIDQLQTEDLSFDDIAVAGDAEVSEWWGVTLAFLQILQTEWPAILTERNRLDPSAHRNAMLRGEARRLEKLQPESPVIVAGSTGTIPATAELIATVAKLPAGAVVLPGYDLTMDAATIEVLDDEKHIASAVSHPQFGMHNLVRKMGATGLVEPLGLSRSLALRSRDSWVKLALQPAPCTFGWQEKRMAIDQAAYENVAILNAPNEREEAAAIAVALRKAIADPNARAALVTPDRMLARRVVTELARYGVQANDSGGTPFNTTLQGSLVALMFSVIYQPGDAAALLALLKNPLVQLGVDADTHRRSTQWLERLVLRGSVGRFSLGKLHEFAVAQIASVKSNTTYRPDWVEEMTGEDERQASDLAAQLDLVFAPLVGLASCKEKVSLQPALEATILTLESLTKNEDGDHFALFADEAGAVLRGALVQFLSSESGLKFDPAQWPEIMDAVLSGLLVQPEPGGHPRVSIWGALEARLQSVDFLVLAGLNEGVWPQQAANDAFLTRGMKARMKMQPPERRIGLAAHDFQMAMGQDKVLLTRSVRLDNAPAVASRWLQRLETLAGNQAVAAMQVRGRRYQALALATLKITDVRLASRPNFAPPIDARPSHFSVTEVERLRRDPYALYAKKTLRLAPLDPLTRDPDAATRGTLIHKILEEMTVQNLNYGSETIETNVANVVNSVFENAQLPEDIEIIWRARFNALIDDLIIWEKGRDALGVKRFAEIGARRLQVADSGVTLGGRPDRLDQREGGLIDIIDFKTGGVPSAKQVRALLAPQMPLEVALLKRGGFEAVTGDAAHLLYLKLGSKGDITTINVCADRKNQVVDANELGQRAWEKLVDILAFYADPTNGYISRAVPALEHDYSGEYDHLARVLEWSAGVDGGGDAGEEG